MLPESQQLLDRAAAGLDQILAEATEDDTLTPEEQRFAKLRLDSLMARVQNGTLTMPDYNALLKRQVLRDRLLQEFLTLRAGQGDEAAAAVVAKRADRVEEYLASPESTSEY